MTNHKLNKDFFTRDVLTVAPELLGKRLCRRFDDGTVASYVIAEVEAYNGTKDLGCHASKGRTDRTEIMFHEGGVVYVYLIYGMYWLLNFVTGTESDASAVLIRGVHGISGPGRLGRALKLDKSFYGENLLTSDRIWLEDAPKITDYDTTPRIGLDSVPEPWKSKKWRFVAKNMVLKSQ